MLPVLAARYLMRRRNDKLGFADSIYRTALQQTGSRAVAAALTAMARQESDFNWRGDNNNKGGGNHGIFNVSTGVWNQWQNNGVNVKDPGEQVAAYLRQLQSVSPDTYRAILGAQDPQSVLGAIQQDKNFHFGTYSSNQKVQRRVLKNADDFGKRFGGSTQSQPTAPAPSPSNLAQEQRQAGAGIAQFKDNSAPDGQHSSNFQANTGWPQQAPPPIPHEDIPFAIPQSMPDNTVPEPQGFGQFTAPPAMPNVPDYVPQTYDPEQGMDIGGGLGYGVPQSLDPSYQDAGFSIPTDFSAVPEGSYASQQQQSSMIPITGDINQFSGLVDPVSQNYDLASYHLPQSQFDILNSFLPDVLLHPNEFEQQTQTQYASDPSGAGLAPTTLGGSETDDSATQNVASNDIQNFGGDMSLGGDLPSSDAAIAGYEGGDPYAQQFYAANDQYGEGGWYYDQYGDIQQNPDASAQTTDTAWQPQSASQSQTSPLSDLSLAGSLSGTPQDSGWQNVGYGAGSAFGAGWAGTGGAGFGGYGGLGGSGAPQYWSSHDPSQEAMHGGVDPSGGSSPGPGGAGSIVKGMTVGEAGIRAEDNPRGIAQWDAQQEYINSLPPPAEQFVSGYTWQKNPGWQNTGSQRGGGYPAPFNPHGLWAAQYTTDPSLAIQAPTTPGWQYNKSINPSSTAPLPPTPPEKLATGGAIDIAQWMNRKSGKVPGKDRGVDEVRALLEPGELVINKSQLSGLRIGDKSKLRSDQIRAIKGAQKRKAA